MRTATITLTIQGKDVSKDLTPHLLSFSYTDKADDELDDLQLVLEDREGLWQGDWLPKHGDVITAKITTDSFRTSGQKEELDCGKFEVDELTLDCSRDSGDVVTVKGVPAVAKSSLFMQRKTRAWENTSLVTVAADITKPAGLDLLYKAPEIIFARVEQRQESDLAFLSRVCKDQGLRLALKSDRIVIYSGQSADALEPLELKRGELDADRISLKRTLDGVYTECRVGYSDALNSEDIDKSYAPDSPPSTGKVLTINKRIEHPAQAERLAKAELRSKNSQEMTGSFDCMGDTRMRAGSTLQLKGWGNFDTEYVVQQATHTVTRDAGYRTSVELVKSLEY